MARPYTTISFVLVLAGLVLIQAANGDVYYVATDVSDCKDIAANASCNTLDHYARSNLRVQDSVFYFMPGKHLLRYTWNIMDARNLTLTSQFPGSESSFEDVVLERTNSNCDHNFIPIKVTLEYAVSLDCMALAFYSSQNIKLSNWFKGIPTPVSAIGMGHWIFYYRFRLLTLRCCNWNLQLYFWKVGIHQILGLL